MAPEQRSGIVTPEAVVLEFETAGVSSRAVAKFLDLLVMGTLFMVVAFLVGMVAAVPDVGPTVAVVSIVVSLFLILFGYPIASESLWNGRTLGKAALGLRVVTREGAPVRFRHSFLRGILGFVETLLLPFVSVITCAFSRNNQRVGDLAGGTLVLRERTSERSAVSVTFPPPPGMEGYIATLDVASLDSEQYRLIRSFLMRVFDLTPEARAMLAWRLANPVAVAMHHDPPPALSPELFLACVASAYQIRHGGPASSWGAAPVGAGGYASSMYGTPTTPGYPPPPASAWQAPSPPPPGAVAPGGASPVPANTPWRAPPPPSAPPPPDGLPAAQPASAGFGGLSGPGPGPGGESVAWPDAPPTEPPSHE